MTRRLVLILLTVAATLTALLAASAPAVAAQLAFVGGSTSLSPFSSGRTTLGAYVSRLGPDHTVARPAHLRRRRAGGRLHELVAVAAAAAGNRHRRRAGPWTIMLQTRRMSKATLRRARLVAANGRPAFALIRR
jgi:hypothetical protein